MFKLQNMRGHRHLKWPGGDLFGVVIISFIFFYGWNNRGDRKSGPVGDKDFAKLRSASLNPLEPWRHTETRDMALAKGEDLKSCASCRNSMHNFSAKKAQPGTGW